MTPYIDIQNLYKSFGDLSLLEDISFSVNEGQHIGLIAKNGSGKTTLLNILCGLDVPDQGNIVFRRGLKIGFLEQNPVFSSEMSVIDACLSKTGELADLISRYERISEVTP